jgi:hypothetical protein
MLPAASENFEEKNCNNPLDSVDKSFMPRKPTGMPLRGKMNLTIHPEIRAYADELAAKRRRSISQLFEDLIEAEWIRLHQPPPVSYQHPYPPAYQHPNPYYAPIPPQGHSA